MSIPDKWTRGIEDDAKEFESKLKAQRNLFERLYDILDELEDTNYRERIKKSNYDRIAWSEFQADAIGYNRALSEIKLLLKFTKD